MPLVPWIGLLVGLLATGHAGALALSRAALAGWIVFDIVLAWLMFRAASRPRARAARRCWRSPRPSTPRGRSTTSRTLDSDPSLPTAALRTVAVAGPIVGTIGLAWASRLAARRGESADSKVACRGMPAASGRRPSAACTSSSSAAEKSGSGSAGRWRRATTWSSSTTSPAIADRFAALDVQVLIGNGTNPDVLQQAGVPTCDFLVAATGMDEVNVLAALIARRLGSPKTICLTSRDDLLQPFGGRDLLREHVGVDRVVWPEGELAENIGRIVAVPGALDAETFAQGRVALLEYRVEAGSRLLAAPLSSVHLPRAC